MKIILASNSPRRKELLTQAGVDFEVKSADVEEITTKTNPDEVVIELNGVSISYDKDSTKDDF